MMKKILIRVGNSYRFRFASSSSIHDYNYNILESENCRSSLIISNRSYSYSGHQNLLRKNFQKNFNLHRSLCRQNILRYKTTESATAAAKEENLSTKDKKTIEEIDVTPLTRSDKFKKAVKEYGSTVIIFHVGISLMSLGTCYLLVNLGLDVTKVFTALGLEKWLSESHIAANAGTFAVAYAIHKIFAPVRVMITLTSVPLIVKYLRRIRFLKK